MIALTIEVMEELGRSHVQKVNEEIEVSWLCQTVTIDPLSSWKSILNIVQQRQNLKYNLSFFDHVSSAVTIEVTAGN